MRKIKKTLSLVLAAALLLLPDAFAITASAEEEPATYCIRYLENENAWRTQKLSVWDDSRENAGLEFVTNNIKEGDLLVIEGNGQKDLRLEINVRLNNVTVMNGGPVVVTAKNGIDHCFILKNSVAAINGDITNAYVYDNGRCNLNDNVTNLYLQGEPKLEGTVVVGGTVSYAKFAEEDRTLHEFYNFAAGTFVTEKGIVKTDASQYSTTAPSQSAPAPAPAAPSADEYDEVPKTGENNSVLWLLCIGIGCLAASGYILLRKKETA